MCHRLCITVIYPNCGSTFLNIHSCWKLPYCCFFEMTTHLHLHLLAAKMVFIIFTLLGTTYPSTPYWLHMSITWISTKIVTNTTERNSLIGAPWLDRCNAVPFRQGVMQCHLDRTITLSMWTPFASSKCQHDIISNSVGKFCYKTPGNHEAHDSLIKIAAANSINKWNSRKEEIPRIIFVHQFNDTHT